jgi:hypothetical protein
MDSGSSWSDYFGFTYSSEKGITWHITHGTPSHWFNGFGTEHKEEEYITKMYLLETFRDTYEDYRDFQLKKIEKKFGARIKTEDILHVKQKEINSTDKIRYFEVEISNVNNIDRSHGGDESDRTILILGTRVPESLKEMELFLKEKVYPHELKGDVRKYVISITEIDKDQAYCDYSLDNIINPIIFK